LPLGPEKGPKEALVLMLKVFPSLLFYYMVTPLNGRAK
jgi:hypothetical protein